MPHTLHELQLVTEVDNPHSYAVRVQVELIYQKLS